jgi:hypothetical protein
MKYAIALLGLLSLVGRASGEGCPIPPNNSGMLSERLSPARHEQRQREREQRATYEALLAADAPEKVACAAALNPQVFQAVAPTYFGHSR